MEHLKHSGFLVSSSHNLSLQEQVKTMQESMLLPLIILILISLLFQTRPNMILPKLQQMVFMYMDCSWKVLDGMKRKKQLKSLIQRYYSPTWSIFGFYQEREMTLIMVTHSSVQFTRLKREQELFLLQVTPPTSCFTSTFQFRRNTNPSTGLREVSQCLQDWVHDDPVIVYSPLKLIIF